MVSVAELYDYVDMRGVEMAEALAEDAERGDQSAAAQEGRAVAYLVDVIGAFVRDGTPIYWLKVAAFALAVVGRRGIDETPEPGEDEEIPF